MLLQRIHDRSYRPGTPWGWRAGYEWFGYGAQYQGRSVLTWASTANEAKVRARRKYARLMKGRR